MKKKPVLLAMQWTVLIFGFITYTFAQSEVKTYPAPAGEAIKDVYTITVNDKPVDVYAAQSEYFDGDYYFASFDFSGKITIKITSKFSMDKTEILPTRFGIQPNHKEAKAITFEADKPFRISIEPNGRIKPLLLFGNAMETDIPNPNDPNIIYFAPGVHRPGKITLTDNQTLYLAGGSVVKGCIYASGKNIVVRGRGILAGEESPRFQGPGRYMFDGKDCQNLTVRDIILRNPWSWTAVTWNCDGVLIDGLKICGTRMINDDALDLVNTQNAIVRNCFFRTQDDSIAIKGMAQLKRPCENIRVENCQFWTDVANIFRIGYECETDGMRNIHAKQIDVLHYSKNKRSPSDYWANAIIWLQPNLNMVMENCHFDDMIIHSDGSSIIMLMAKPMSCIYGNFKDPKPGSLKNCSFKNIHVIGNQGNFEGLIHILGNSPKHNVDGLKFENIKYFNKPIKRDSPCVEIKSYSSNITF